MSKDNECRHERLLEVARAWQRRRFRWGGADCVIFGLETTRAMTGRDLSIPVAEGYATRVEADEVLRRHAGGDLEYAVQDFCARHAMPEIPVTRAGRGDLVIYDIESRRGPVKNLGVCMGATIAAPSRAGLAHLPLTVARRAWRVA